MLKHKTAPRPACLTEAWARSNRSRMRRWKSTPCSQSLPMGPHEAVACGRLYFMAVSSKSLQASRTHPRECLAVPYLKPVRSRWSTETAQTGLAGRLNEFAWSRLEMRSDNFDHPLRRCAVMKEPKISRIPQIVPTELEID